MHYLPYFIAAALFAIVCSNSVGGFLFRAAVVTPLVWTGVLDQETATFIAMPYGEF